MNENFSLDDQSLEILYNSFLFSKIDKEELKQIIKKFTPINWKRNETIDSETGMKYFYIIIKGRLKITSIDPESGRSISLFILSGGDIYDTFTLIDGKEHIVFPIAMDDIYALRLPLKEARKILKNYPDFNAAFLPYLGQIMRELEDFGESLVFNDTSTRLAKLILKYTLPKEKNLDNHHPVKLINNLSHESLAEMIGSVRSVVSTQMEKLKKDGIILSKRGYLAVKDLEKLLKKCDIFQDTKI